MTDVREALAEVILAEHEPGFANVQSSKARDALLTQFREVADAVLRSGLVWPTDTLRDGLAENLRLRATLERWHGYGHGPNNTHYESQLPCAVCDVLEDFAESFGRTS